MKPAKFEFHAPRTLGEVLSLLDQYGEDARVLAGGQSLVPLMNFRILQPAALISINHCPELARLSLEGGYLRIGALVRQIEAERSPLVQQHVPLLARALPQVGGVANRNRGTVCGSLAHADPLAELTAVAAALDARFVISSVRGQREVSAKDFFIADLTTCIEPGEMLEAVLFPLAAPGTRAAFVEVGNRGHGFAVVGVGAQLVLDAGERVSEARIAAIGVDSVPLRLSDAEQALMGRALNADALAAASEAARQAVDPTGSFHADAAYKRRLVGTLVARAVQQAQGAPAGAATA